MRYDSIFRFFTVMLLAGFAVGCARQQQSVTNRTGMTFAEDVEFLRKYGDVQVLRASGGGRVAVSAQYQARVMTSAITEDAVSLGWINHEFIEAGETGTQFDNYGGEDRFWLGPEGGQYGFYFPESSPFEYSAWQVPEDLHMGKWRVQEQASDSVRYIRSLRLKNYSGIPFHMSVVRTVRVLNAADIANYYGIALPDTLQWTGFETKNTVTNLSTLPWNRETGLPSIWILGMFNPFDIAYVALPYDTAASGEIVNDEYFGKVPSDRIAIREGYVLFKCDGEYRSKIGLGPHRATPTFGSYIPAENLLTLIHYNQPAKTADYVNSMWRIQEEPYGGDVINSYNDGPPEPGVPPLGGFYELETSSPALDLGAGASYTHVHRTLHIAGVQDSLDAIAEEVLGVSATTMAQGI